MNIIDVTNWDPDQQFKYYPEGSREKRALYCPTAAPYESLSPGKRYMLKFSRDWAPHQYWSEIVAYHLGLLFDVPVPTTHIAIYGGQQRPGALIEWFYDESSDERYVNGGNYMMRMIENYDIRRGGQHNFTDIAKLCRALRKLGYLNEDWIQTWARILAFDALIGNTDRHHDNWGLIWVYPHKTAARPPFARSFMRFLHRDADDSLASREAKLAPAFDNGTSLIYEIPDHRLSSFGHPDWREKYAKNGHHHMKWNRDETHNNLYSHIDFLLKLMERYPRTKATFERIAQVDLLEIEAAIEEFTMIDCPEPLSPRRAKSMYLMIEHRMRKLRSLVE